MAKDGIVLVPAEPKEKEKEKEKEREKPCQNKDAHEKDRGCRCNICGQCVKVKENLQRHQEENTRCRKYQGQEAYRQCKYCGKWVPGQEGAMYQHINSEACLRAFESKRRRKDGAGDGDNGASAKVILQPREPLPRRRPDTQPRHDPEPEPMMENAAAAKSIGPNICLSILLIQLTADDVHELYSTHCLIA